MLLGAQVVGLVGGCAGRRRIQQALNKLSRRTVRVRRETERRRSAAVCYAHVSPGPSRPGRPELGPSWANVIHAESEPEQAAVCLLFLHSASQTCSATLVGEPQKPAEPQQPAEMATSVSNGGRERALAKEKPVYGGFRSKRSALGSAKHNSTTKSLCSAFSACWKR